MMLAAAVAIMVAGWAGAEDVRPVPPSVPMARIGPGVWRPIYPVTPDEKEVPVKAFLLDRLPVTNSDFLAFVRANPSWKKGSIATVFAESGYLGHWAGPETLGSAKPNQPVVGVSWFAAEAYCEAREARLPTENEWEFAASADERHQDARQDPEFRRRVLAWYSAPSPEVLPSVGRNPANAWGVQDLHGLAWEWVLDFGAELAAADNRDDGGADRSRYCGGAALAATAKDDYAAFLRIALRGSLEGRFTTKNLGFRCAVDVEEEH